MPASERPLAVITGGAGGMGVAAGKRLAATHHLLLLDRAGADLDGAAARVAGAGGGDEVSTLACDIVDAGSVAEAAELAASLGPLGALVHTAGVTPPGVTDPSVVLAVNLRGTRLVLDAFAPQVVPGTVGVLISSLAGHRHFNDAFDGPQLIAGDTAWATRVLDATGRGDDPLAAYSVSKRGVIRMAEHDAAAWGRSGGRLVSISPGLVADTGIGEVVMDSFAAKYATEGAVPRPGAADDIAALAEFLISPAASYITGCDILVDGGMLPAIDHHRAEDSREAWHDVRP
ncbi:MAG: SDR family oxidoreductase [Solirubrobacteraceae bacterium]|nr:SDR family oxidoreductase [Patulibacter sp.]